jgi:hypothetical protein
MADRKKTILAILGAAILIVLIFAVLAVVGVVYFFRTHVAAIEASDKTAIEEIARTRDRFAGQTPMIERSHGEGDDFDRFVVHRPDPGAEPKPVEALRVLAYNPRDERMVRVRIPFWILRLAPRSRFNLLEGTDVDLGRTRLTLDDLERHGPGLILDAKDRRGSQVLVWLE